MAAVDTETEILALNQRLLEAISSGDWKVYEELCHPDLTCFEPETRGNLVAGMAFHQFYFDMGGEAPTQPPNTTMASPKVWVLGPDAAAIVYVRLVQRVTAGGPVTSRYEETRIWKREAGRWQHVHFHRASCE